MKVEEIKKVAVIGSGEMGSQLAELFARVGGFNVVMIDISDDFVNRGLKKIESRLESFYVAKGKMTADDKKAITARIGGSSDMKNAVKQVDFVIEAVTENMALKKDIFKILDENAPANAVFASNTSYLNISEMASATKRPDKVAGMHFFNPVAMMKLVEVVKGGRTSAETVETVRAMVVKLGKEPVSCKDTSFGFLANRAYRGLMGAVLQMVWERVAPPSEIDKSLKLGYNFPMGPLELMDMVGGWSVNINSEPDAIRELGEEGRVHPILKAMWRAGYNSIYKYWDEVMSKE